MSDTTGARRRLLALLLDRVERGALLTAEAPLIRPLVLADQTVADTEWSHTERAEADVNFNADRAHEERQRADRVEAVVYRLRQAVREARAAALPHSELDGFVQQMTAILDTPSDGGASLPAATDAPWLMAMREDLTAETRRSLTAEAAIDRVRELHRQANNGLTCVYCAPMQRTGYDTTWPCDTIRALDVPPVASPSRRRVFYRANDEAEMHATYMDMLAAITRVRALSTSNRDDLLPDGSDAEWNGYRCALGDVNAALDGPAVDEIGAAPAPVVHADTEQPVSNPQQVDDSGPDTCQVVHVRMPGPHADGANWPGDTPAPRGTHLCHDTDPTTLKECALHHDHAGDHADANVTWPVHCDASATASVDQAIDAAADEIVRQAIDGNGTGQILGLVAMGAATPVVARCSPLVNANCPGHLAPPYCERASSFATPAATPDSDRTGHVTDWATSADDQCPARYTGESPHLTESPWQPVDYQCERRAHAADSDHTARQQDQGTVFCWTDAIAIYPTDGAPSEPQQ